MVLYCNKNTYNGSGGVTLHNSGHGLALRHVFGMICPGIVHVAASYGRKPECEIPQRYLSRRKSFIDA